MKKLISIVFIMIAATFCFKDLIILVASDSASFVMDVSKEEEGSDKTEKSDIDEKSDLEEWQLSTSEQLQVANLIINTSFQKHKEKSHFTPYFEICSPPPELI